MFKTILSMATALALAAGALAQTVTVSLTSPQNGQTVSPGAMVNWSVQFSVSSGDNQGLSLLSTDLTQDAANPAFLDIPPASGVPGGMSNFARPAGVTNPPASGYLGSQRGTAGRKNLLQIGGAQNTFGMARPGTGVGESANVVAGVGQSGSQLLATGSFAAPAAAGTYTFRLANTAANTLIQRNNPPAFSPTRRAATSVSAAAITFTVSALLRGDVNCDGLINNFDIDPFVLALTDPVGYHNTYPTCDINSADINNDGFVNNFDIDPFVICLTIGCP